MDNSGSSANCLLKEQRPLHVRVRSASVDAHRLARALHSEVDLVQAEATLQFVDHRHARLTPINFVAEMDGNDGQESLREKLDVEVALLGVVAEVLKPRVLQRMSEFSLVSRLVIV